MNEKIVGIDIRVTWRPGKHFCHTHLGTMEANVLRHVFKSEKICHLKNKNKNIVSKIEKYGKEHLKISYVLLSFLSYYTK